MPSVVELFAHALRLYQAGQWQQAQPALRQVLAVAPRHGGALHVLGSMAYESGRHDEAAQYFGQAAAADPGNAFFQSSLGAAYQALGRSSEARACHERALQLDARNPFVLNNLGISLVSLGETDQAVAAFRQALALGPGDPDVLNNLAAALRAQGKLDEATVCCQQALRLRPDLAEAHHTLGNILLDQGQPEQALACYERALQIFPGFAKAHVSMGRAWQASGRLDLAIAAYRKAIQVRPDSFEAHTALGDALLARNQAAEALAVFEQARRLRPDSPEAYNGLGNSYFSLGRLEEAEASYCSALDLLPAFAVARYNLGLACQNQGRLVEARACYQEALRLRPEDHVAHSTYVGSLLYDPQCDTQTLLNEHRRWAECHAPGDGPPAKHANPPGPARRLRVGYVSPDLRSHAVAFFLEPILTHHDPARVETFCYADVAAPDATTARLRVRAHHWRDTFGLPDERLMRLLLQDQIDILVDLAGHTAGNRLRVFARKPAPVQVAYLGYSATTGVAAIDYRLADAITDPPGEPVGDTEELVRLPGVFCCYAPPEGAPEAGPLPAGRRGGVTFGSLHKLEKLNPAVLDVWGRLLREVPEARLLLTRSTLRGKIAEHLADQLAERGIERSRIVMHQVEPVNLRHLRVYDEIDVALDPFPWGGHTTACEALWMGVPVVTLRGQRHSGRMVASILSCLGLDEWIADRPEGYVRVASRLAADLPALAEWRSRLRGHMRQSLLCDGGAFTRGLEEAYRRMWQHWCEVAS